MSEQLLNLHNDLVRCIVPPEKFMEINVFTGTEGLSAKVAKFAGYNCSRAPSASGCSLQQDFAYLLRPHFC